MLRPGLLNSEGKLDLRLRMFVATEAQGVDLNWYVLLKPGLSSASSSGFWRYSCFGGSDFQPGYFSNVACLPDFPANGGLNARSWS